MSVNLRNPDTIAIQRMRARLAGAMPRVTAHGTWAAMPIDQKRHLCMLAFGVPGIDLADRDWRDIGANERRLIGSHARREAGALV